ncbi:MAG: hypothetical protein PVI23_11280 [Maricaulaceae bacterium]|jgi:predicted protein tyrosine phosphatase
MKIIVCSLERAPHLIQSERPSHVVSLLSPEEIHLAPETERPDRHLRLPVHDIRDTESVDGALAPNLKHVENLIGFSSGWSPAEPMLVHCWAGISRSTAAAFTVACAANPDADETEIAQALRIASPTAWPNPVLVAHADALLGRGGRMIEAIDAIGVPDHFEASPFHIAAAYEPKER